MTIECRRTIGLYTDNEHNVYETRCVRHRFHFGDCKTDTARSRIRSFYDINRETWPDMGRREALISAIRCYRMVFK
jgi:hypothetical protein